MFNCAKSGNLPHFYSLWYAWLDVRGESSCFPSFRVRPALTCFCLKLHLHVSWPCLLPPPLAERSLPPVILQPGPNLFPLDRENDFMTSRSQLLQGRRGILGGDGLQNDTEFFCFKTKTQTHTAWWLVSAGSLPCRSTISFPIWPF